MRKKTTVKRSRRGAINIQKYRDDAILADICNL